MRAASWRWQPGLAGPEAQVQAGIQASGFRVHTWTAEAVVQGKAKVVGVTSQPKRCRDKTSLVSILDSVHFTSSVWALLMGHRPTIDIVASNSSPHPGKLLSHPSCQGQKWL